MQDGNLITDAKGRFAEAIVSTILEYAGYRVLRLGVEEVVSEVKAATARRESPLKLPQQLSTAPDFLVIDPETGDCTLVEVKYRRTFDDRTAELLFLRLSKQVELWPATVTIVVCSDPGGNSDNADIRSFIRCLRSDDLHRLNENHPQLSKWGRLRTLGGVFDRVVVTSRLYDEAVDLVAPIKAWARQGQKS